MQKIMKNYNKYSVEARNIALEKFDIHYWKKQIQNFLEILR